MEGTALVTVSLGENKKKEFIVRPDLSFADFIANCNARFKQPNSCADFIDGEGHEISCEDDWEVFLVRLLRAGKSTSLRVKPRPGSRRIPPMDNFEPPVRFDPFPPQRFEPAGRQQRSRSEDDLFAADLELHPPPHFSDPFFRPPFLQQRPPSLSPQHKKDPAAMPFEPSPSTSSSESDSSDEEEEENEEIAPQLFQARSISIGSKSQNFKRIQIRKDEDEEKEEEVLPDEALKKFEGPQLEEVRNYLTSTDSENTEHAPVAHRWVSINSDDGSSSQNDGSSSNETHAFLNSKKNKKRKHVRLKSLIVLKRLDSLDLEKDEFEVTVTRRPFGIKFGTFDDDQGIYVRRMKSKSIAAGNGVEVGDLLIGLNGKNVESLPSAEVLDLWKTLPLPFQVAFKREPGSQSSNDGEEFCLSFIEDDDLDGQDVVSISLPEIQAATWRSSHATPGCLRKCGILRFVFSLVLLPVYFLLFLLLMLQLPFGLLCQLLSPCCARQPRKQLYAFNGKQIRLLSWNMGFIFDRMLERRPLLLREMLGVNPDVFMIQNALVGSSLDHKHLTSIADRNYVPYIDAGFQLGCLGKCGRLWMNPFTSLLFSAYAWLNVYFFEPLYAPFLATHAQPHSACGFLANVFFGLAWTRASMILTRGHGFSRDDVMVLDSHRVITRGLIQLRGRKVWLVNCDCDFLRYDPDDTSLAERIVSWLEEGNMNHNADGVILCGTFNSPQGSKTYDYLKLQGFSHSVVSARTKIGEKQPYTFPTPISTVPNSIPGIETDFVWTRGVEVMSVEFVGYEPDMYDSELYPSSHLGILTTLSVED